MISRFHGAALLVCALLGFVGVSVAQDVTLDAMTDGLHADFSLGRSVNGMAEGASPGVMQDKIMSLHDSTDIVQYVGESGLQPEESTEEESTEDEAEGGSGAQKVEGSTFHFPVKSGNEEKMYYEVEEPERTAVNNDELGELLSNRDMSTTHEAAKLLQAVQSDTTNARLFDLVPIWKGIVADDVRSAAMVKNCVLSMDLWITRSICKAWGPAIVEEDEPVNATNVTKFRRANEKNLELSRKARRMERDTLLGEGARAKQNPGDVCREYALEPMSEAMNELWRNIQHQEGTGFQCAKKDRHCDATLCYKSPGPMDANNEPTADFHTFTQVPLSVVHNKTSAGDTVVQQMVDIDIKLEKIQMCEKLVPELRVPGKDGMSQPGVCHTARRCQIVAVRFGNCLDGVLANRVEMSCPDDEPFKAALVKAQMQTAMMLCNSA